MRTFEVPSDSLSALDPQYVRMYLSGSGWKKTFSKENYDVYRNASGEEVHVPRRSTFSDYPVRIRELLSVLSETEGRRGIDIYSDISLVNAVDSVQYRISDGASDGTISASLLDGIIDAHRSISASAYMDLLDPNRYHPSCMKGFNAMKGMRIGQTGYGSYILRFIYPYGDPSQLTLEGSSCYPDSLIKDVPSRIVESSRQVIQAAEENIVLESASGISYNFVDSLMGLSKGSSSSTVQMCRMDFATASIPEEPVSFSPRIFPRIAEIADSLRPKELSKERQFEGWIRRAEKDSQNSDTQRFRLTYLDEGDVHTATVVLCGEDIAVAHRSMMENKFVSFNGISEGYSGNRTIGSISGFRMIA